MNGDIPQLQKATVKVRIDADEWYPVYSMVSNDRDYIPEFEVPTETVKRWARVAAEFSQIQTEMREIAGKKLFGDVVGFDAGKDKQ